MRKGKLAAMPCRQAERLTGVGQGDKVNDKRKELKQMKKIGLICLALVLALGAMGVGIANWNETLDISGSVATGNLDIDFTGGSSSSNTEGVATCVVTFGGEEDAEWANIAIDNAYPDYTTTVTLPVQNNGSIPVKAKITVTESSEDGDKITVTAASTTYVDIAKGATYDFTVTISVNDDAAEDASYGCSLAIHAKQFNDPAP